jgi:hypothetical protein
MVFDRYNTSSNNNSNASPSISLRSSGSSSTLRHHHALSAYRDDATGDRAESGELAYDSQPKDSQGKNLASSKSYSHLHMQQQQQLQNHEKSQQAYHQSYRGTESNVRRALVSFSSVEKEVVPQDVESDDRNRRSRHTYNHNSSNNLHINQQSSSSPILSASSSSPSISLSVNPVNSAQLAAGVYTREKSQPLYLHNPRTNSNANAHGVRRPSPQRNKGSSSLSSASLPSNEFLRNNAYIPETAKTKHLYSNNDIIAPVSSGTYSNSKRADDASQPHLTLSSSLKQFSGSHLSNLSSMDQSQTAETGNSNSQWNARSGNPSASDDGNDQTREGGHNKVIHDIDERLNALQNYIRSQKA